MKWAYGVTAHVSRADSLLVRTVESLNCAGFLDPLIFMDGYCGELPSAISSSFLLERPNIGAFGNFYLGLVELHMRYPNADRYAMFQDDLVCCRNLREYLDKTAFPAKGYLNLYTWACNEKPVRGFTLSDQWGRGAVALVFSNEGLRLLLSTTSFVNHRKNVHNGHKAIDKAVMEAYKSVGWREFVHNPSLVQHTGLVRSIANNNLGQLESNVFCGEDFDAMSLLRSE